MGSPMLFGGPMAFNELNARDYEELLTRTRGEEHPAWEYLQDIDEQRVLAGRLAHRYARREHYVTMSIVAATFTAAIVGLIAGLTDRAWLAIVPGGLAAFSAGATAWGRSARWGHLADSNMRLSRALERELAFFSHCVSPYDLDIGPRSEAQIVVERCEWLLDEAHSSSRTARTRSDRPG